MSRAYMRGAVGASVLSTALLIGGPLAVAAADTESGADSPDSSGQSQSSTVADRAESASIADLAKGLRATFRQSVTGARTALDASTAQPESGIGIRPPGAGVAAPDPSSTEEKDLELSAPDTTVTEPEAAAPEPESAQAQPLAVTPQADDSGPSSYSSPSQATMSVGRSPASPVSVPPPHNFGKLPAVANTVGNTIASVLTSTQQTVAAVPALLVALPTSATPVADVITTIEFMLTSVSTSVGTIVALPGELGALMGVSSTPVAVLGMDPGARATVPAAPVDLPGLLLPEAPTVALSAGAAFTPPAAPALSPSAPLSVERVAPVTTTSLGVSGLAASGAPESFLDRAVSTLLVPVSIATLAAVALPGVGGLLVICALGIRIGYRQAKAGWAIRISGIARFAGSGPIGIVRSGSMIALHTKRPSAARRPGQLRLVDRSIEHAA